MGVNNLLSFLRTTNMRASAKLRIEENRAYDLFIDLAIIVVPLMQRAKNVLHFERLLQRTFDGSRSTDCCADWSSESRRASARHANRLVDVIVGARRVSMYLDMFSPKMKIETHNSRNVKMLNREAAAAGSVSAAGCDARQSRHPAKRTNAATNEQEAVARDHDSGKCGGGAAWSTRDIATCSGNGVTREDAGQRSGMERGGLDDIDDRKANSSSEESVGSDGELEPPEQTAATAGTRELLDVVDQPMLPAAANRAVEQCCGRLNVVKLRDIRSMLSHVILGSLATVDRSIAERCTIDTDVVGEGEIKCFRSAINRSDPRDVAILSNDNDIFLMMLIHQEKLVTGANGAESNLFYRILINDTTDELTDINIQKITIDRNSVLRRIPASRRWCVLLWLICCSGTDFVSPLRPFSSTRRVEIFQNCLVAQSSSLSELAMRQSAAVCAPASSASFSFNSFMCELRRFVAYVEQCYSVPVSAVSATTPVSPAQRVASSRSKSRSLYSVSTWVVRLYWNLLYIIDLPVDFFRQPTFSSDASLPINSYVPNVYTSFFLTSSVFKHLYDSDLKSSVAAMLKFV